MNDENTTLMQMKKVVNDFIAARGWQKFHRPKNLAMSIAVEAAELMECFQWETHEECDALLADEDARKRIADEMADVLSYLLSMSSVTGIDLAAGFEAKMKENEKKYPVEKLETGR